MCGYSVLLLQLPICWGFPTAPGGSHPLHHLSNNLAANRSVFRPAVGGEGFYRSGIRIRIQPLFIASGNRERNHWARSLMCQSPHSKSHLAKNFEG